MEMTAGSPSVFVFFSLVTIGRNRLTAYGFMLIQLSR
ncbi:Hypothetical protein Tpal_1173 [Trichococcus palustris]|uniref:Uncharacterized protein n=1 Tax=Trichococcus palustris TaxID=140314 RepID=A0A143YHX0_9LACT|nr:Hypothetical protein Tpal_1173 [Trichococcus palustris]